MKKVGLLINEKLIDELKDKVNDSNGCLFIGFNKVSSSSLTNVRNDLHRIGAKVMVTKNSLIKKAFKDVGVESLDCIVGSETGVVTMADADIVGACKVLIDFSKQSEFLKVKGGLLKDKIISSEDVSALAKLPSREVLLGMVVGTFAAPITGFLALLKQMPTQLLYVLEEIKKKKEKQ